MDVPLRALRRRSAASRLATLTLVFAALPAAVVAGAGTATAGPAESGLAGEEIGTVTGSAPARLSLTAAEEEAYGGLQMVINERGRISRSIAGVGASSSGPIPLTIEKPVGATVRKAYMAFASRGNSFQPLTTPPQLEGSDVPLALETPSPIGAFNYFAEVTDHVKAKIDSAQAGRVTLDLTETDTYYHEGTVLVVVFDDPAVNEPQSVTLLFGAINPDGDTYGVTLAEPIDKGDPDTHMDMSLGISYGYQALGAQYSTIDVNGARLTSAAGGADDGQLSNGALITVGGVGDSLDNPTDPYATPTGGDRSDDELYDLLPFVGDGDTRMMVNTHNPSNDDNVFLATLTMNPPVRAVTTDGDTLQATPEIQKVPVGLNAYWEVGVPEGQVGGFLAPWKARITDGPNVGRDFSFGCAAFACSSSFPDYGVNEVYLRPQEAFDIGTDIVRIWFDADDDDLIDADEEFADVAVQWLEPAWQVAMGDSYSSGEGVDPYDDGTDDDYGDNRNQCHRSQGAWGRLVAPPVYGAPLNQFIETLGTRVDMVACSGATTLNVISGGTVQYPGEGGTQIDQGALSELTDLVTISIGGNDVGFSNVVTACALKGCDSPDAQVKGVQVKDYAANTTAILDDRLNAALTQIKSEAPNATVILLGYPHLFSDTAEERDSCPAISELWDADSQTWMNTKAEDVSRVMRAAAAANGVHYLSPIEAFRNHEICGSEGAWIAGVELPNANDVFGDKLKAGTGSFHPTGQGHELGYARVVNDYLAELLASDWPTNAAGMPVNPSAPVSFSAQREMSLAPADEPPTGGSLEVSPPPADPRTACYDGGLVGSGAPTRIWGSGFAPGSTVDILWQGQDEPSYGVIGTATASASGQIATLVTTPRADVLTYATLAASGNGSDGRGRWLSALVGVAKPCPGSGPVYAFAGFYGPVDNPPVVNTMTAGRSVPISFSLGGDQGLAILAEGSPRSRAIDCASQAPSDEVEQTATAGSSSLSYDALSDRYQYVWKTDKAWTGTCREFTLLLADGSQHKASFSFR